MARLYVIGPVSGIEGDNRAAFEAAREALQEGRRFRAVIPHDFIEPGTAWRKAMMASIHELTEQRWGCNAADKLERCVPAYDGVALLDGWRRSYGACLERDVAQACGLPCKTVGEWLGEAL